MQYISGYGSRVLVVTKVTHRPLVTKEMRYNMRMHDILKYTPLSLSHAGIYNILIYIKLFSSMSRVLLVLLAPEETKDRLDKR